MEINLISKRGRRSGYSLLEVMAAIAIGIIMIAVLFTGFTQGNYIMNNSRQDLRATQILLQKAEAIRLLTWSELAQCPTTFQTQFYPPGTSTNQGSLGIVYYGTLNTTGTATNIPSTVAYQTNIYLITIGLTWTNYFGSRAMAHSRQIQTMSAYNGMQNYIYGGAGD